jgi:hypothetical protein
VREGRRCGQQRCLGYLMRFVGVADQEQLWCRCMRDADCAWLLMVVVLLLLVFTREAAVLYTLQPTGLSRQPALHSQGILLYVACMMTSTMALGKMLFT